MSMKDIHLQDENMELRINARGIVIAISLGKAIVAGIGAGIALLGALDIAFAATAREWWNSVQPDRMLDYAAAGGGLAGFFWQLFHLIAATK